MIAVVGGYGVGMTMRLKRAPEAGETVTNGILSVGPGGKGSNQAIAIARLGHAVGLFTGVGRDAAAADARELWSSENVGADAVVTTDAATMTGFITVDAGGENRIAIAPGALASLVPQDLEAFRATIREADLLVVSLEVPVAVAVRALEIAREEGTRTLLNPAPAAPLNAAQWALVDTVTPNATEARDLLAGRDDRPAAGDALALRLAEHTGCDVVLTLGESGCAVASGGRVRLISPITASSVVDTTGAGDAFTAALAVGLVEGLALEDAAHFAAAAGSLAVAVAEVIPALPTREQVADVLDRHDKEFA